MTRSRSILAVVAALTIVLAGCGSIGTQTSPTVTGTDDGTPGEGPPSGEALKSQAIEAMESIGRYQVEMAESRTVTGNLAQTIGIEQSIAVDRSNRKLHADVTQSVQGQTIQSDMYLLNETLYQRSPTFVQQFSTEWIKVDLSGNFSTAWRARDSLGRQRRVLEASEVWLNGTEQINRTDAYRLEANASTEGLERLFVEMVSGAGSSLNDSTYSISDARFTFWISTETSRPVKVSGRMNSSYSIRGQSVDLEQSFSFTYTYDESVAIDLPEGASDAVALSDALNRTRSGS